MNLYDLTKSYLRQCTATLSTNNVRLEREGSRGCPQGSCWVPGLWNIKYSSLLNLPFERQTKAVAFAIDLILVIRGESVRAVQNFLNVELGKIAAWSKNNKVSFNEEKSKVMLMSRRKRKDKLK
jgi:hypothetical protein